MGKFGIGLAVALSLSSTAAVAGVVGIPVSEPGTIGLVAGAVVAAVVVMRLRGRK